MKLIWKPTKLDSVLGGLGYISTAVVSFFSEMTNFFCLFFFSFRFLVQVWFHLGCSRGVATWWWWQCCWGVGSTDIKPITHFSWPSSPHQTHSALVRWQPSTCSMVSVCKSCCNQRAGDAGAEAGSRLGAGGADVVPHSGLLAAGAVQVGYGARAVGPREPPGSGGVTAWVLKVVRTVDVLQGGVPGGGSMLTV